MNGLSLQQMIEAVRRRCLDGAFGLRASALTRAALPDQILFGLLLPGAELMLAMSLHGIKECGERQMLVQHLNRLCHDDLLLLGRGFPSRWLVALLTQRVVSLCMRVDKAGDGGFACVRFFAPVSTNQSSRSTRRHSATPPTTTLAARPSRFGWYAMLHRPARCAWIVSTTPTRSSS